PDIHFDRQRRTHFPGASQLLDGLAYRFADFEYMLPTLPARFAIVQRKQPFVVSLEKNAAAALARNVGVYLFRSKAQHGRNPAAQRLEDVIHRGLRRPARQAVRPRGVKPILDDIEVESTHVKSAEVMHLLVDVQELVTVISLSQFGLQS